MVSVIRSAMSILVNRPRAGSRFGQSPSVAGVEKQRAIGVAIDDQRSNGVGAHPGRRVRLGEAVAAEQAQLAKLARWRDGDQLGEALLCERLAFVVIQCR